MKALKVNFKAREMKHSKARLEQRYSEHKGFKWQGTDRNLMLSGFTFKKKRDQFLRREKLCMV